MITSQRRQNVSIVVFAWFVLFVSANASAQQIEISMYGDWTDGGSVVDAYVELFDTTDFSQWQGQEVYHYDYSSTVYVYGDAGSDSAQGAGLGPFYLQLPYQPGVEDTFTITADVDLTCSASGPLGGTLFPIVFFNILAFNLHYDQIEQFGPYYEVRQNSYGKVCAAGILQWGSGLPETMTFTGTAIGYVAYVCTGGCSAGHSGSPAGRDGHWTPNGDCPGNSN